MPNNYMLPGDTLPRETAFHAAGHLLATQLFATPGPPTFWHTAGLVASDTGAKEAIAEVVAAVSIEVDIAVTNGMTVLDDISRHMEYLYDRSTCAWGRTRTLAHPLTDDEEWVETAALKLLQRHWWGVSTLAKYMQMGHCPTAELRDQMLADVRCSPYAWDQVIIPLEYLSGDMS